MAPVSAILALARSRPPLDRRLPRRPADDPHVRRDAAARDRRVRSGSTGRRWVRWAATGISSTASSIWGVIAGIIGARVYHDITSWNQDSAIHAHWYGPFAVWSGGLGIWGAIPFGVARGAWVVRRSGNSVRLMMDAVAPGLLLAQGIGRWGNWWNQELYGKHTTLPWALEIHGKATADLYHPTFLYEFLWDVLGVLAAALDRPPLQDPPARALRALRRDLHGVPHVRGDAAHRPVEPLPRPADQLLGLARRASSRASRSSSGGSSCATPTSRRAEGRNRGPIPEGADAWPSRVGASGSAGTVERVIVRELELDLDAFEGPFDLLLTLVLKDELDLRELDVAADRARLPRAARPSARSSTSRPAASSSS